ncbi:zf-TFIIB domain-containing protein [Zavarzinia sp. CC-PAN008]|uniref:TFIIB-type zinc ribbon-containing protein n=1 Tax=Zavarzinia sp. CC-PAN008 TaxID=3243332 RepID=UPI003F742E11
MPLLVCPNDNATMQTVSRSGVEFDFCPTCRGVWLDRGELEKLMSAERDRLAEDVPADIAPPPRGGFAPPPPREAPPPDYRRDDYRRDDYRREEHRRDDYRRDDYRRDDDRRHAERRFRDDDDDDRYRKRKGFSILDIFD